MKLLRQVLLSAMGDQIARKVSTDEVPKGEKLSKFKYAYRANNMEDLVFLQDSSVLRNTFPEFVVYQEIYETNKIYMRGVTAVDPEWLPVYVPALCNMSDPLAEPPPFYNAETGRNSIVRINVSKFSTSNFLQEQYIVGLKALLALKHGHYHL